MKISKKLLKQIIREELESYKSNSNIIEGRCGCHGCPGDHGEILVAYDATGKEVMRSQAFKDDEADQLTALVPVLQAQGFAVEIIPAPHEHPMAVSVMDAPEDKIY